MGWRFLGQMAWSSIALRYRKGASWADGHYLTMDVDAIGSTAAGADVTVGVEYTY